MEKGRGCPVLSSLRDFTQDPLLPVAITPVPLLKPMKRLNNALRRKDLTVAHLVQQHATGGLSEEVVELCIRSLDDANCYVRDNAHSLDCMKELLKEYFDPEVPACQPAPQNSLLSSFCQSCEALAVGVSEMMRRGPSGTKQVPRTTVGYYVG